MSALTKLAQTPQDADGGETVNNTVVIVTLFTPVYDADNNTLTYPITVVPDDTSPKESIVAWCAPPFELSYERYVVCSPITRI